MKRKLIANYFSRTKAECLKEIEFCYNHQKFGPNQTSIFKINDSIFSHIKDYSKLSFINPHGAYCDGGPVMAHPFYIIQKLQKNIGLPNTVIFIGNSHQYHNPSIVTASHDFWETPFGDLKLNKEIINKLINSNKIGILNKAHEIEHSIENQIPLLAHISTEIQIVPITVSNNATNQEIFDAAQSIKDILQFPQIKSKTLIFGTTDFTHAGPAYGELPFKNMNIIQYVKQRDLPVINSILNYNDADKNKLQENNQLSSEALNFLNTQKKEKISMCGEKSAALTIEISKTVLQLSKCKLLQYAVAGEILNRDDVTGFGSLIFFD